MDITNGEDAWWKFWRRRRQVVCVLAFFGFFNIYALRVNLSVAIVAITSPKITVFENQTTVVEPPDIEWDFKLQGVVLSSFFYGYICTQLLGGWLAARFGGARIYCFGIGATALCTLISPPIINSSVQLFIFLRIVEGLFEGVTYPCIHAVWSKWAPVTERAALATFAFSGSYMGTVITLPLSGYLAKTFGWTSVFYVTGLIAVVWVLAWVFIVKDNPEDDPYISEQELKFLKEQLGSEPNEQIGHPWKEIFTSLPVWAIVCAHFCENWGFYTLLTQLPTFMKDTLDFDIKKVGLLSSLPYLVMCLTLQVAGRLADYMCNKNVLSRTNVRKLFNAIAFLSQTVFMMLAGYMTSSTGVITCLVMAVGLGAFAWPAFSVNPLDLAPRHASVLLGISNTFATIPGIVSPLLTGFIVNDKSQAQWRVVFFISSGIYLCGAIFYSFFASAELQPWANKTGGNGPEVSTPDQEMSSNGLTPDKGRQLENGIENNTIRNKENGGEINLAMDKEE